VASKKSQKRSFNGMSYVTIQRANSENRSKLKQEEQEWLKTNRYKNVGWDNVVTLYLKIEELLAQSLFGDMSLEELFLEAERVGNKYLTIEAINEFNQQLSQEVSEIAALVDEQFPDTEVEFIDFSQKPARIKL